MGTGIVACRNAKVAEAARQEEARQTQIAAIAQGEARAQLAQDIYVRRLKACFGSTTR